MPTLLAALGHSAFADGIPDRWADPAFMQWLKRVYLDPNFTWAKEYSVVNYIRQAILNALADCGGTTSGDRLASALPGMTQGRLRDEVIGPVAVYTGGKVTAPVVQYTPHANRGARVPGQYSLFACDCGLPLVCASTAPELPRKLLCSCGRMSEAEAWGVPADVRFPFEYRLLIPTPEQISIVRNKQTDPASAVKLGPTATRLLAPR